MEVYLALGTFGLLFTLWVLLPGRLVRRRTEAGEELE
jgi:hypothetical protein